MMYLKSCNTRHAGIRLSRGILLADILLALSLASVFVLIVSESSMQARDIFDRARERSDLLDAYENGSGSSQTRPYGNDRIQTETTVYSSHLFHSNATYTVPNSIFSQSIAFTSIFRRRDENDSAGTPLCSVEFSNFQTKDVAIVQIILPIDPLLPLTDIEVRSGIAYISVDSSKTADADLMIADISDEKSPRIISMLDTGPGISAIALAGNRIFAAAASTAAQLHIIRLDSLDQPVREYKYQLSLPYATATPSFGSAIFYNNGLIYLGTEKWDGDEFSIIDVNDPISPNKIGGYEIGNKVNDIFVRDGIAYVAASGEKQMRIFDVHDPTKPIPSDSFSPSGWQRQEGKTISSFEGYLDFGRTSGGFDIRSDHELFAWSSTTAFQIDQPHSMNIPGGIYGILRDRSHTYAASGDIDREFQVFDNDLSTTTAIYSLPVAPRGMTCDGDRIYILARTAPVIYEILFK